MIEKKSSFAAHGQTKPSNSANPNITPVRVAASRQLTFEPSVAGESEKALEDGSANDGTGTIIKQGLIFGHKYDYKVAHINDSPPDNILFNWLISYQSPDTSKNQLIEKKLPDTGEKVTILIDDPDMCGCEITIRAYFNDPKAGYELKQNVHNRFRWFDSKKVDQQINERLQDHWRIDQGYSSLCGMAALYYVMLKKNPDRYRKLAKELHRTGLYAFGKYKIKPSETMYGINPQQDEDFKKMRMWEVDWIVLAATRSSESHLGYNGIEKGSFDQLGGVNWPNMLTKMLTAVAGYNFAENYTSSVFTSGHAIEKLIEIDRKYRLGDCQFLFEIEPGMISNTSSFFTSERHWIVYAGGLEFDIGTMCATTVTPYQYDQIINIKFNVYTWGRNPNSTEVYFVDGTYLPNDESIKTFSGISKQTFEKNYHGYIEAR